MTPTTTTPDELGAAHGSALKVIFLDIDGVLSSLGIRGLCSTRLDMFADIVKKTGAEVVLSSTWRYPHCRDQRMRLQQELGKRGVEFFGMTPILDQPIGSGGLVKASVRGDEIQAWLDAAKRRHQINAFVILDDDPNNEMGKLHHALVKCNGYQGLTTNIAAEVARRLNAEISDAATHVVQIKPSERGSVGEH